MKVRNLLILVSLSLAFVSCRTARAPRPLTEAEIAPVRSAAAAPEVQAAMAWVDEHREAILEDWIRVTEVPAKSGQEAERAKLVRSMLAESPSVEIRTDEVGNIIAVRRGTVGEPDIVVDSHLDTVFTHDLDHTARIENGRIYAPGVGDNTRNIVAAIETLRALDAGGVKTKGDLIFLFTVEEETNFRGIDHFLEQNGPDIEGFLALDGGYSGFTYGGIGTNWYRHHFIGPGGHTRSRTPPYSATLPVARAIARIYKLKVPNDPPSHVNVGMIGGSQAVNVKAEDGWLTIDLRSTDAQVIARLERQIERILREEAGRAGMELRTEVISKAPPAQIAGHRDSHLVRTIEAVYEVAGFTDPSITPTASNHSSAALRKGVPAISTGTAPCGDAHAVTEFCEIEPFYAGIKKLILMEVATAGLAE